MLENKLEAGQQLFGSNNGDNDDELVERAIQVISQTRKASATLLQRKLGVGFARAARIMDILEEEPAYEIIFDEKFDNEKVIFIHPKINLMMLT